MTKPVILTGVRANNDLQIGNYFGAILPIVEMATRHASEYQINLFIPDLHSFTTPINHSELHAQIQNTARIYAAAGLPLTNDSIHMYRQSYVPAHSQLTWILDCFTGVGEMGRMTEFKDKTAKIGEDRVSVGLFNYPVLMTADVLLYNAQLVPVGDDQRQHLEFMRDIAERMNNKFGDLFLVPHPVQQQHEFFGKGQGLRIKDLQNPLKKMSKSDESGKGVIFLGDSPKDAAKKIMSATTDDKAHVRLDYQNQPGISNLLEILALLQHRPVDEVAAQHEGTERYGDFKAVVAREVETFLSEFQATLQATDTQAVLNKLESSEAAMNIQANATLYKVQQAIGIRPQGA